MLPTTLLTDAIQRSGYVFVPASATRGWMPGLPAHGTGFAASWDRLALDTYMADGGRYRRRRYAVYQITREGLITRQPPQPHYQLRDYNPLNGGIKRWFEPIEPGMEIESTLLAVIDFGRALFTSVAPAAARWHVEAHQFRIESGKDEEGQPTPEGTHRDGVDYVLVLLIRRLNIERGTTTIYSMDGELLGSFTLTDPLDMVLLDDRRVQHGVTPVKALDALAPAYRDVLVLTFRSDGVADERGSLTM